MFQPTNCHDFTMAPRPSHHGVGLVQRQLVQGTQEPGPIHPVLPIQDGPKVNLTEIRFFFLENGGLPSGKPT
jgi:hypothetical protein